MSDETTLEKQKLERKRKTIVNEGTENRRRDIGMVLKLLCFMHIAFRFTMQINYVSQSRKKDRSKGENFVNFWCLKHAIMIEN